MTNFKATLNCYKNVRPDNADFLRAISPPQPTIDESATLPRMIEHASRMQCIITNQKLRQPRK